MRFDDSLSTVLAADATSNFGAQSAWRQLVDLVGRRRVNDVGPALRRLEDLRDRVPREARAASGRALAIIDPPPALVEFFARDELGIAAPVLRAANLAASDWVAMLPRLGPGARAVLRHRRDLPADVMRGLESFGPTDFVLGDERVAAPADVPGPTIAAPLGPTPFVSVGEVARSIPVVAAALKQVATPQPAATPSFAIADLVARIDAYQRERPAAAEPVGPLADADHFRFATDATGVIRWVDGVARGPLVGVSLAQASVQGLARLDAAAGLALRNRTAFRGVRLTIAGRSGGAGEWRLSGAPSFDPATARFAGFSGIARRAPPPPTSASDQLRQLIHELRTPANAISGFAELIEGELLGPVAPVYRDRAALIQRQAADLLAAIEDLDTAARIEGGALDVRLTVTDLTAIARRAVAELAAAAAARAIPLAIDAETRILITGDDRATPRLVARLIATILAIAQPGERLRVQVAARSRNARLTITRPRGLLDGNDDAALAIDPAPHRDEGPLLGQGFTLRLLRNFAEALGGRLGVDADRLTLRLPLAQPQGVEATLAQ